MCLTRNLLLKKDNYTLDRQISQLTIPNDYLVLYFLPLIDRNLACSFPNSSTQEIITTFEWNFFPSSHSLGYS